jgi:hypothetical protein
MSKKTLLNEGTIRRFMKLAEIGPLTGGFIKENFPGDAYADDDEPELGAPEDLGPPGDLGGGDLGPPEDLEPPEDFGGEEELDVELEPEGEEEADGELTLTDEEAEAFLAVADRIRDAMDAAPEPEEVPAPDMGEPEAEPELGLEPEVPGEEDEEELADVVDDESLVNEVARRVAKRLLTKKRR